MEVIKTPSVEKGGSRVNSIDVDKSDIVNWEKESQKPRIKTVNNQIDVYWDKLNIHIFTRTVEVTSV